jgi:hypothetical protein
MDVVEELAQREQHNLEVSFNRVGDTITLVEDEDHLYETLARLVDESGVPPRDEIVMAGMFLTACRYQLSASCLTALRGYPTESLEKTRKAIELTAFANRIRKHPHLAKVWLEAGHNEVTYKAYRDKFTGKKLFPENEPLMKSLGNRYDFCSKVIHSSVYSLGAKMKFETQPGKFRMYYNISELRDEDPSEPVRTVMWNLDTHLGIVRVFALVLDEAVEHDRAAWEVQLNGVDARLGFHKHKWKSVILSHHVE